MITSGTTSLYAALNVGSGQVIADMTTRHRAQEYQRFLNLIDGDVAVHVVLDNSSTHKSPSIQRSGGWSAPPLPVPLHPHLQLVDEPGRTVVRRADHQVDSSATPTARSANWVRSIRTWITTWNDEPIAFVWHKTAGEILDSLAIYCQRINDSDR